MDDNSLGSYVVDELVFPITRLWLADGQLWVEAHRGDIWEPLTVHDGAEFRIHAPDGSEVLTGLFRNHGASATAVGDRKRGPAYFTITQPISLADASDGIRRPV